MAYQNIYFLHYNNYYNRIVKREKSLDDYRLYQVGDPLLETNFNPNDGVNTVHFVNWEPQIPETMPDYCVIQEIEGGQINSCWFVIEAVRTLQGQMRFTLRRDLIADFYDEVTSATSFIEKATLSPSDPFIFNREDFIVNQIKKDEILLKDGSKMPWIVGYLANNIEAQSISTSYVEDSFETVSKSEYFDRYIEDGFKGEIVNYSLTITAKDNRNAFFDRKTDFNFWTYSNGWNTYTLSSEENTGVVIVAGVKDFELTNINNRFAQLTLEYETPIKDSINLFSTSYFHSKEETNDFLSYKGKTIQDSDTGKFYYVSITQKENFKITRSAQNGSELKNRLWSMVEEVYEENGGLGKSPITTTGIIEDSTAFKYSIEVNDYSITLIETTPGEVSVNIPATRNKLNDAPYSMFAIPYGNRAAITQEEQHTYIGYSSTKANMVLAQAIAQFYSGSGGIYDLQLLPYCPVQSILKLGYGPFDLRNLKEGKDYSRITLDGAGNGFVLWCKESSFSFDIPQSIEVKEPKIENQCDTYRISSPNYSGIFEFSAAKNGGVSRFNVDCTYKPYSPYIHVNPDFGGLYGIDYNDSRGLICTGDFSLPVINDAWSTYQVQNKNFSEIFARQISNMEVNNAVQREREIWGAAAGAVGAATSGGITGALSGGGPIGAIAGATIGGSISAIAGVRDVQLSDQLRSEALDYTRDMYGYNLGNIRALPYGLAKTSAITANNKLFPFLEYYSCTDEEKQAFRDKLKYNGMTVMRIGQIEKYLQIEKTYIKARIIRMENLTDEFHLLNEIAAEMAKGVFI